MIGRRASFVRLATVVALLLGATAASALTPEAFLAAAVGAFAQAQASDPRREQRR